MTDLDVDQFNKTVESIYASTMSPSSWRQAILHATELVGASSGQVVSIAANGKDALRDVVVGLDNSRALREFEELVARGEQVRAVWAMENPALNVLYDYQHSSEEDMASSLFYQEHARPLSVDYYVSNVFRPEEGGFTALALFRTKKRGHFSKAEIDRIRLLSPHMSRALILEKNLTQRGAANALSSMLQNIRCGALAFDSKLDMLAANKEADKILSSSEGLSSKGRRLLFSDNSSRAAVLAMMNSAVNSNAALQTDTVQFCVRRFAGQSPLRLVCCRVRCNDYLDGPFVGLMLIIDPDTQPSVECAVLQDTFELSPSEAIVVRLLVRGLSIPEIAKARSSSVETVRTQIKAAMRKTSTRKQAELVAKAIATIHVPLVR